MKLNPSVKHHLTIGTLLSLWSFAFAFFTRPFEHGEMDFQKWVEVSVGYSLIAFFSYALVSFIQKLTFQKLLKWNIFFEVSIYFLFYAIYTLTSYYYYQGPIIRGIYDFQEYFLKIILNIMIIFTPLIIVARHYSLKLMSKVNEQEPEEDIIIKGENKLDFLKIRQSDLVCVSNTQNYVEIFYLENEELKTKLIRSSLKKIKTDFEFLTQIHRSHLINPKHFKSWKDSANIYLTNMELPVSKTYKNNLL